MADWNNGRIVKWVPGGIKGESIINVNSPWDLHVDSSGNIFVSSHYNHEIYKFTLSDGEYSREVVAGGNGNGSALNQLNRPTGIYVDSSSNIYIADRENHRIIKYEPGSSEGLIVAGGNGRGEALNQLNNPYDVTLDSSGNIYVADWNNNRLMKWVSGSSEGVNILSNSPRIFGVDVDMLDNIYATRYYDHDVIKLTSIDGSYTQSVVAGGNGQGDALNQFNYVHGIFVDNDSNIYVVDEIILE